MFKKMLLITLSLFLIASIATAAEKAPAKNPIVVMETSRGTITMELFEKEAPLSVKNFLEYANSNFFEDTIFHRVIPGFMIQGGGFTADRKQKPTNAPIKNEAENGLKNDRGTLAMARTNIVDSATAQFFINVANNDFLNHRNNTAGGFGYAVFGKVINGMDVVDKIVSAGTENVNMVFQNLPVTPIFIKSVKVQK